MWIGHPIPEIRLIQTDNSKVKVNSQVKGQGHVLYPVSNRCTSFSFHINQLKYSWEMGKIMSDLEKDTAEIFIANLSNKSFQHNLFKFLNKK